MHIRQAIYIEATPAKVMDAARTWMQGELQGLDGEVLDGVAASGSPSISSEIVQDGIRMSTTLSATPSRTGSTLVLDLETRGVDVGARMRNMSLLPGRRLVSKQAQASLQEIKAAAEQKHQVSG